MMTSEIDQSICRTPVSPVAEGSQVVRPRGMNGRASRTDISTAVCASGRSALTATDAASQAATGPS